MAAWDDQVEAKRKALAWDDQVEAKRKALFAPTPWWVWAGLAYVMLKK